MRPDRPGLSPGGMLQPLPWQESRASSPPGADGGSSTPFNRYGPRSLGRSARKARKGQCTV